MPRNASLSDSRCEFFPVGLECSLSRRFLLQGEEVKLCILKNCNFAVTKRATVRVKSCVCTVQRTSSACTVHYESIWCKFSALHEYLVQIQCTARAFGANTVHCTSIWCKYSVGEFYLYFFFHKFGLTRYSVFQCSDAR